MFITFEGGEGAGKTTLMGRIYEALRGRGLSVIQTKAPGGTKVGEEIRALILYRKEMQPSPRCELFLFLADRAQHVEEVIAPALKNHYIVLCDRFNDSTVAYQGGARGFDKQEVRRLCSFASAHLEPDLTLYLDVDPEVGLRRIHTSKDRIESEQLSFHRKIRQAFHEIARDEPKRFHLIDAARSPDEVFAEAMRLVEAGLQIPG